MSHLFTQSLFSWSKCFLFQDRDDFTTTSKTKVEKLEEDYTFLSVALWNNMVSTTTDTVTYWS